jgi:hypothetical protein
MHRSIIIKDGYSLVLKGLKMALLCNKHNLFFCEIETENNEYISCHDVFFIRFTTESKIKNSTGPKVILLYIWVVI